MPSSSLNAEGQILSVVDTRGVEGVTGSSTLFRSTTDRSRPGPRGGDGFFPPFARFDGAVLFSPILLQSFLSSRNAIYGFANHSREVVKMKEERGEPMTDLFGSLVANDLERYGGGLEIMAGDGPPTSATLVLAAWASEADNDVSLTSFIARLERTITDYIAGTNYRWEPGQIVVGTQTLDLPLLKFDERYVAEIRDGPGPAGLRLNWKSQTSGS